MFRPSLMRMQSNDGTKYNLLTWTLFSLGVFVFVFFVVCGSLITPEPRVPQILACFIISGAALVIAVYAVTNLVAYHNIRRSRSRSSSDYERAADSDPEASHARLISKTDPIPINGNQTACDSIESPSFSPPQRPSPAGSLLGLVSGDSLRSRSWQYLSQESNCRFRRAFSYDSSVSSISPYAYGTFCRPDSNNNGYVRETDGASLEEHPIYAVPNKTRIDLGSGLALDPNYHLPLDCLSSSSSIDVKKVNTTQTGTRSGLENLECYFASQARKEFSSKDQFQDQRCDRSGLVKNQDGCSQSQGVSYANPRQVFSSKDQRCERSGLVRDSGHSNPAYDSSDESSMRTFSSKDRSRNRTGARSGIIDDHSSASTQALSNEDRSQDLQSSQKGFVEDSLPSGPTYGLWYARSRRTFPSNNRSHDQNSERSGLVRYSAPSDPAYGAFVTRKGRARDVGPKDPSPEYYYPMPTTSSSSSSDRTTVLENPFVWPKPNQPPREDKTGNTAGSSTKDPTEHNESDKGRKVRFAGKIYKRKIPKRHVTRQYLKVRRPQVYVGIGTYVSNGELKVVFERRIPSYSSEISSLDEDMGPSRV